MTTFIFRLAHNASAQDIERVHDELSDRFPYHRFIGNGEDIDSEFNIMALSPPAGAGGRSGPARQVDPAEVDLVKHAFFSIVDGWG